MGNLGQELSDCAESIDRKELIQLCAKARHTLYIRNGKYILRHVTLYQTLTYDNEQQVVDFCNKTIDSWKRGK